MRTAAESAPVTTPPRSWWWGFALFTTVSLVHVVALGLGTDAIAAPTKLALMPALAVAALWAGRGSGWGTPYTALFLALALSWLGDGAGAFFPDAPTVPVMLLCFGLAHLVYIWLFARPLALRRLPAWSLVYAAWWVALLLILWPHLGGLAIPVAAYGLVLGGTAAAAARCGPVIATGGAFFLVSDTVLAFRLFLPEAMPGEASPVVMLTYCLGQGLLVAGVVRHPASRREATR
ncbi:lysoplasmalogenase [Microbacterium sp. 18062]|uniref:lysoplasmalogenase n=1 Tax=Microbacterium sp. 18062 TaxID=2681410 RepID=UPI001357D85C|nr:lysoplasmalogenase [Microbacterium sp. 18062]